MGYSQCGEEEFIAEYFKKNPPRHKVFCDVGAFDGILNSNTRAFFEAGWSGVLVEPLPYIYERLESLYRGTDCITINAAVGMPMAHPDGKLRLHIPEDKSYYNLQLSTCLEGEKARWPIPTWKDIEVPLLPLSYVMSLAQAPVEFLSVDCEGMDCEVLESGFLKPHLHLPALVVVEHNNNRNGAFDILCKMLGELGYRLESWKHAINAIWSLERKD